jgi:MoxR-like ATPase
MISYDTLNAVQKSFVDLATEKYGENAILSRKEMNDVCTENGLPTTAWLKAYKIGHGQYQIPSSSVNSSEVPMTPKQTISTDNSNTTVNLMMNTETQNLIPSHFEGFVPWGHCSTIKKIIQSRMFYPVFITGLSGNGKTLMVEELHSQLKRELIRVNITIETDEDDLLGGFRLIDGETKFVPGPVIQSMERGCTLLLDECDLGSNKLLALQPVLEGKGVFLKKINKWITPKPGFNVIATANTKGKGSDDGRFVGTNILNEAFLERFAITIEQPYPSSKVEKKIILGSMEKYGKIDDKFAENLCTWAEVIRKTFYDGGVDELISTRRLDHIVKAFSIFKDKMKAIELCVSRFDDDTKESFVDLYTKVDAGEDIQGISDSDDENLDDPVDETVDEDGGAVNY